MKKYLSALLILFMIFLSFSPLCAFASEKIDSSACGSISITVKSPDKKELLEGVEFNFYRVGDISQSDDKFVYTLAEGYKESGVSLAVNGENEFKKETAAILTSFVQNNGITGISVKTNDEGTAFVGNCKTGLYLVVPEGMPSSLPYGPINPFLISLPAISSDGDTWEYSVKAAPKVPLYPADNTATTNKNGTTTKPSSSYTSAKSNVANVSTSKPYNPTAPTKPSQLPNTGMLKWPVPIMAAAGPVLFAFGYLDVIGRKKRNEK